MKYTREYLEELIIIQNLSYKEIGRILGITDTAVRNAARRRGIVLPKRAKFPEGFKPHNAGTAKKVDCANCGKDITQTFGNKYCSQECSGEGYSNLKYQDFLKNNDKYCRANYTASVFKNRFLEEQNGTCALCPQTSLWNGKPLVFVLDHIDGDAANNKRNNLRLVCHNCDSQLDTYKSKNKNSSRHYARYGKEKKLKE